jgi:hypothetical protein
VATIAGVLSREHRQSGRIAQAVILAALAFALVGAAGIAAAPAGATVPTWSNPCSGDIDVAACERLTFIAETLDAHTATLGSIDGKLDGPLSVTCDETCASSATTATLSDEDHHRLDLTWWGVWALVGLGFVSLIAAAWFRAWNIEGKLGHG